MDVAPNAIARESDAFITIQWSDGTKRRYSAERLRAACPCATCREKHKDSSPSESDTASGGKKASPLLPVLSLAEAQPLSIQSMQPVGNYAYNIAFSDGHDSGIFTFDFLHELGEEMGE